MEVRIVPIDVEAICSLMASFFADSLKEYMAEPAEEEQILLRLLFGRSQWEVFTLKHELAVFTDVGSVWEILTRVNSFVNNSE